MNSDQFPFLADVNRWIEYAVCQYAVCWCVLGLFDVCLWSLAVAVVAWFVGCVVDILAVYMPMAF